MPDSPSVVTTAELNARQADILALANGRASTRKRVIDWMDVRAPGGLVAPGSWVPDLGRTCVESPGGLNGDTATCGLGGVLSGAGRAAYTVRRLRARMRASTGYVVRLRSIDLTTGATSTVQTLTSLAADEGVWVVYDTGAIANAVAASNALWLDIVRGTGAAAGFAGALVELEVP